MRKEKDEAIESANRLQMIFTPQYSGELKRGDMLFKSK
jgi:hypothetical protein